jgi:hypothetical protein
MRMALFILTEITTWQNIVSDICNPSYLVGRDQEDWGLEATWGKKFQVPISTSSWA